MDPSTLPNLESVRNRAQQALLRSGRSPDSLRLVGVSKKQSVDKILQALSEGLLEFGENYVQEWQRKYLEIQKKAPDGSKKIHWHFLGHLQTNKVRDLVGKVEYLHTLDRLKLAQKVSQQAAALEHRQKVLIEVNLGEESSKSGYDLDGLRRDLPALASLPNLSWEGLMAIPPPSPNPEAARPYFRKLKSLLDECNQTGVFKKPLTELSMGMSQDFEVAIEEGATMIRVGTALFGPRQ